jgi:hypothetical protein
MFLLVFFKEVSFEILHNFAQLLQTLLNWFACIVSHSFLFFFHYHPCIRIVILSAWNWFWEIRNSLMRIKHDSMGVTFYSVIPCFSNKLSSVYKELASSFLNLRSYQENSLKHMTHYFHIIFFVRLSIWWNKFFVNVSLTIEEWYQHHFVFLLVSWHFVCLGELSERHSMLFLFVGGSYWKRQVSSPITVSQARNDYHPQIE